ncbi:MAG: serine/threonine-protein kinase [Polyangiaceae bacterium]|jgi:serine/threonine-protein kinase
MMAAPQAGGPRTIGRYILYGEIASGGMATVHFGRLQGAAGFARSVAIKRLHPQYAKDPDFVAMFLDEARLAARISHPNVVPTLDVVAQEDELFLVMEYVRGVSLSRLSRASKQRGERIPVKIVAAIVSGMLNGLHAAHEAKDETGEPLHIVHRDVSPQNVLVGTDGVARVLDFGVAKAVGRVQGTREGQLKGKLAYMAPEQITTGAVSRQTDIYAAGVVLWEVLVGRRLFFGDNEANIMSLVLAGEVPHPSHLVSDLPAEFDRIVLRGTDRDPEGRFATAREMASEVAAVVGVAPASEVGEWVEDLAPDELRERAQLIEDVERSRFSSVSPPSSVLTRPDAVPQRRDISLTVSVAPSGVESSHVSEVLGVTAPSPSTVPAPHEFAPLPSLAPPLVASFSRPPHAATRGRVIAIIALGILLGAAGTALVALRLHGPGAEDTLEAGQTAAPNSNPVDLDEVDTHSQLPGVNAPTGSASASPAPSFPAFVEPHEIYRGPRGILPPRSPDCSPPYTTDDKGHVHFKPACL